MINKISAALIASLLLSGCAMNKDKDPDVSSSSKGESVSSKAKSSRTNIPHVEFTVIKLYAKTNIDSGVIIDNINAELKTDKSLDDIFKNYGTYFSDIKLNFDLDVKRSVDFVSTTTTAHVSKINVDGSLIPGYYNTGIKGSFKIDKLDTGRYVFTYNVNNAILRKLELSPTNKIVTMPEVVKKEFEQTVIVENGIRNATGITNPEPKQYELFIIKISDKEED